MATDLFVYKPGDIYAPCEVLSCAQHIEAKQLANKLSRRWRATCDKAGEEAQKEHCDPDRIAKLIAQADGVEIEFNNVRRGLMRCCAAY